MNPETTILIIALAFLLLMLSVYLLSRFGGRRQTVTIDTARISGGGDNDEHRRGRW